MKTLNTFILEKILINKDTNIDKPNYENDLDSLVVDVLGPWLFEDDVYVSSSHNKIKDHRFEFLKYFNNNINDLIDYFMSIKEIAQMANISSQELFKIINDNNDKLYKKCETYYIDAINEIPF